jgi:hypothetical protein
MTPTEAAIKATNTLASIAASPAPTLQQIRLFLLASGYGFHMENNAWWKEGYIRLDCFSHRTKPRLTLLLPMNEEDFKQDQTAYTEAVCGHIAYYEAGNHKYWPCVAAIIAKIEVK